MMKMTMASLTTVDSFFLFCSYLFYFLLICVYFSQILKKTKPSFNFVHVPEDEDDDGDGVLDVDEDDDNEEL